MCHLVYCNVACSIYSGLPWHLFVQLCHEHGVCSILVVHIYTCTHIHAYGYHVLLPPEFDLTACFAFAVQVINLGAVRGAVSDIAISGLPAWITLLSPGRQGSIHVRMWVPKGVEVFVRPAIPIAGLDNYEPDPLWPETA